MQKLLLLTLSLCLSAGAQYKKITLTEKFYSGGSAFGDLNGDGINDIVAGSFWWEGPDYKVKHQIRKLVANNKHTFVKDNAYMPEKYSNSFANWVRDINQDGKNDILIIGLPGTSFYAYLNPGTPEGKWQEVVLRDLVDNESPELVDIDGDGTEELICNYDGYFGYAKMNPAKPLEKWTFHKVSAKGKWYKYTHGIGMGDVNNDGRMDMLAGHGWLEQPANAKPDQEWIYHKQQFSNGERHCGAQMFAYDVDGDGKNDLITSGNAHGYGLYWFKNIDNKKFEKQTIMGATPQDNKFGVKFSQLHALKLIDMDKDGLLDIVTGKKYWAHGPKGDAEPMAPAVLYIFKLVRENSKAYYKPIKVDDNSGIGSQVNAGDVNQDGLNDIVVSNKKGVFVFLQKQ
ncbi:hypothetical protein LNTAR_07139 [Lentisphaera araneosa HTCC2155]|uniref:VCBS repeat-containing protein n=1 Tax=Lentisphaera araneosa HTCC2155 TaxID=313628 RepID=A6DMW3_9BACT|nr:VCBS repeat-containing protein [Lentisphaera araneosa]EDM26999.1 hypothetical protein LNTAR_07139 [Lentisphaera araneosa HTCC2155]